jgi:hypothetical protein
MDEDVPYMIGCLAGDLDWRGNDQMENGTAAAITDSKMERISEEDAFKSIEIVKKALSDVRTL